MALFEQSMPDASDWDMIENGDGGWVVGPHLTVKHSTKSVGRFSVLVRRIFFLYHLKAYLYSFILSSGFNFLGAPFMAYKGLK